MISTNSKELLEMPIHDFIIPAEKVAHVQIGNNAEHALLVLTKTGYSSIPVLDSSYRFHGLISIRMIMDSVLGLERIEYENLEVSNVTEIMDRDIATLNINDNFKRALDLVINHAFLCVIDDEGTFVGIMTRRVILKQLKKYVYQPKS
ncbi:MAG: cyclic-di-AMP-binding protein CbpB [Kurthia gibsonii]|uniref:Cyclic-di-AMP-binding protein CbpB n=1 Tax=Kurthia gibsonii TaxID=33946 RepID=A0ABU9LGF9_9BACL|nr:MULTISPECIES: cyclic-di-AMP-binding protein CbpB [Kurthia]MCA9724556.1 CBS domain-containing protein [Kurthia sp.]AMA64101.1 CBS domain-containing protein ykuL [Kurthia sp. 11kri321]MEB6111884.1 CBS domain-containing protein [Kurthia gibsonii]MEB7771597.1 CBS domain-containing protein [Kurthia gibsonii]RXH53531.1 CBS domain-containing protein [Kurthia gibsonii]